MLACNNGKIAAFCAVALGNEYVSRVYPLFEFFMNGARMGLTVSLCRAIWPQPEETKMCSFAGVNRNFYDKADP
jgi:hypothetical protein